MKITEYEYEFLAGNEEFWPNWGAALAVTMEFCQENGLGSFGKPTQYGKKLMKEFEERDG